MDRTKTWTVASGLLQQAAGKGQNGDTESAIFEMQVDRCG
jgi:hypothetical protein